MKTIFALAAASVCLLAASSAHAQNLVLNPGFETGNTNGWSIGLNTTPTVVTSPVNSGSYAVELYRSDGGQSSLRQNLTLAAAPTTLDFWAYSPSGGSFQALLDGTIIQAFTLPSSSGHVEYTYNGTVATAGSEQLTFNFTPGVPNKELYLDDISVTQVPEPATMTMTMVGGALLLLPFGASRLRRLRKTRTV
jgi:hypothetical protein